MFKKYRRSIRHKTITRHSPREQEKKKHGISFILNILLQFNVSEMEIGHGSYMRWVLHEIELKTDIYPTALTLDSHHLNNESRITAPLFTVKDPLIKTDDMATEKEGEGGGEKDEGSMVQRMTHFWPHYAASVTTQ